MKKWLALLLMSVFAITSCIATVTPPGPTIAALPGTGKTYSQFTIDDNYCRQLATGQAGNPSEILQSQQVGGTILGVIAGTLFGLGVGGSRPGPEMAVGAAAGGITGTVIGTQTGQVASMTAQQRWDSVYLGCMYGFGHKIPGYQEPQQQPAPAPAPQIPPPPPPPPPSRQ